MSNYTGYKRPLVYRIITTNYDVVTYTDYSVLTAFSTYGVLTEEQYRLMSNNDAAQRLSDFITFVNNNYSVMNIVPNSSEFNILDTDSCSITTTTTLNPNLDIINLSGVTINEDSDTVTVRWYAISESGFVTGNYSVAIQYSDPTNIGNYIDSNLVFSSGGNSVKYIDVIYNKSNTTYSVNLLFNSGVTNTLFNEGDNNILINIGVSEINPTITNAVFDYDSYPNTTFAIYSISGESNTTYSFRLLCTDINDTYINFIAQEYPSLNVIGSNSITINQYYDYTFSTDSNGEYSIRVEISPNSVVSGNNCGIVTFTLFEKDNLTINTYESSSISACYVA